ncbi:hypothetical protein NIES2104_65010 [Leptolyngbya sp. NIES-2104]|nr:hypothetical protein NIES2104_65010 [Leptolyngbya sp. NIES-2104]
MTIITLKLDQTRIQYSFHQTDNNKDWQAIANDYSGNN